MKAKWTFLLGLMGSGVLLLGCWSSAKYGAGDCLKFDQYGHEIFFKITDTEDKNYRAMSKIGSTDWSSVTSIKQEILNNEEIYVKSDCPE